MSKDIVQLILSTGRVTIEAESKALCILAKTINYEFVRAVQFCQQAKLYCKRIIVSGVGKSGHIGKKIAATLSSTGNPAYFVHPTEAAHGDLGMITKGDVLLLISKSGSSAEFIPILEYATHNYITIIAITANKNSMIARQANTILLIPTINEVPIIDISAPTNSTTMTLALGDALAMALIRIQGFTRRDFATFHPGGKIGTQLMFVKHIMRRDKEIPLVSDQSLLSEALIEMNSKRLGCVGIINEEKHLCGVFTDGDLRRTLEDYDNIVDIHIIDVASVNPKTITAETLCIQAITLMEDNKITVLFITRNKKPIGIIHLHDLI